MEVQEDHMLCKRIWVVVSNIAFFVPLPSNCTTSIHTSSIQLGLPHPTYFKNAKGEISPEVGQSRGRELHKSVGGCYLAALDWKTWENLFGSIKAH